MNITCRLVGIGVVAIAALGPAQALAQGAPSAIEITVVQVKPGSEPAFQDFIKNDGNPLRIKGGVKNRSVWTTAALGQGGEVYFVRPLNGLAEFDSPPPGVTQAENALVVSRRQALINSLRTYLISPRPELSLPPKPGYQDKLAVLVTQSVMPGKIPAYTTNLKALTAVIAKTNAKGVLVSQTGLGGDPNEFNLLVLFDTFADVDKFPSEFGKAAAAAKLAPEAAGVVAHTEYRVIRYRPELSIVPAQ